MSENLIPNDDIMTLDQAIEVIGIGPEALPVEILSKFKEILKTSAHTNNDDEVILAKNIIMRNAVVSQMEEKRFFAIESPFENSCIRCKGTGELYRFNRKTVEVKCFICGGTGEVMVDCPTCNGSGRFRRSFKGGGGINVKCTRCDENHKVPADCYRCQGTKTIPKVVPAASIKDTTPCKECDQLGFIFNDKMEFKSKMMQKKKHKYTPRHLGTPVINPEQGDALSEMIKNANTE